MASCLPESWPILMKYIGYKKMLGKFDEIGDIPGDVHQVA
jgi:hypothetical protein